MIKKLRTNEKLQIILRFLNYYSSLRFLSLLGENFLYDMDHFLHNTYSKIYNFIFPRDFATFLFIIVTIISLIILDFKKNKLICVSFALNAILLAIFAIVGFVFFMNR